MKKYYEQRDGTRIKDEELNLSIPKDPSNRDYYNFLKLLEEGKAELIPYIEPSITWDDIRANRNVLLTQSDWAIITDATPKPNKEAWLNYRQALREVPQSFSTPESVVWPTKPS